MREHQALLSRCTTRSLTSRVAVLRNLVPVLTDMVSLLLFAPLLVFVVLLEPFLLVMDLLVLILNVLTWPLLATVWLAWFSHLLPSLLGDLILTASLMLTLLDNTSLVVLLVL